METPDTERVQRGREYSQVEITEYQNGEIRANGIPINTPDIEWEKILDMWIEKDPDALLRHYIQALKLIIPKALSSRDTYWKERVRSVVEEMASKTVWNAEGKPHISAPDLLQALDNLK